MKKETRNKKNLFSIALVMLIFIMGCKTESPKQHFEEKSSNIISSYPICNPPLADAGQSQNITNSNDDGFELVNLDGSGSSEDVVAYKWVEVNGQSSKSLGTGPILSYDFSVGIHLVILTVSNECGALDKDALFVNVKKPESSLAPACNTPLVEAKVKVNDKYVDQATILMTEASSVFLDGSESYDPDEDTLNYKWTSCGVEFNPNQNVASPTVELKTPGDYYFILQVNDGTNFSEIDMVKITVKEPDAWVDLILDDDKPDECKFKTIQGAIDFIDNKRDIYDETEKIIAIAPGQYREKVTVKPYIYIIGLKSEKASLPHIVNFVDNGGAIITLEDYVTIDYLDICVLKKGPNDGISTEKAAINVDGSEVKIRNCRIQNSHSDGINLQEGSYAKVTNTLLVDVEGEGIAVEKDSRLKVENCRILYSGGSAIWARDAHSVEIHNCIFYYPGWHGLDLNCKNTTVVEHCTIGSFGRYYENENVSQRCGILFSGGGLLKVKSNLIEIQDEPVLCGIKIYSDNSSESLEFNYIYSRGEDNKYYDGNIILERVDLTNLPNINNSTPGDPYIIDPNNGDFRLDQESPAVRWGEEKTDPGANGDILKPYAPSPPVLSSPQSGQIVDPNVLIFRWERSEDPDGNSDVIKYCITINENGDKSVVKYDDDLLVYSGWDIKGTSVKFKELIPKEKELEPGKEYWWCVQAIDEDGYKSSRQIGKWRYFDIPL